MKRIRTIVKWFFLIWGMVSFLALLGFGGCTFYYSLGPGNRPTNKLASKGDVRFVLNWCRLGADRTEEVVHSYASARSFTGDHLDGHAIRVSRLDVSELVFDEKQGRGWVRGDALSEVPKDAVDFAAIWLQNQEMPWFPDIDEIRSSKMYVYVGSVKFFGTRPYIAEIIFAHPDTKMVYYFSAKM